MNLPQISKHEFDLTLLQQRPIQIPEAVVQLAQPQLVGLAVVLVERANAVHHVQQRGHHQYRQPEAHPSLNEYI